MSIPDEMWTTRLHAAVDDHPSALAFDVPSYLAAGRRRARRRRAAAIVATVAAVAVVAGVATVNTRGEAPQPAPPPHIPIPGPGVNGWVAVDTYQADAADIYLVRPGVEARKLDIAGSEEANEACPAWSPDGVRLLFGRVTGSSDTDYTDAELVIVPVARSGAVGSLTVIGLEGFNARPCGLWAPDGRWVALAGADEVWVVDTQTGDIRRLPDLRPLDLEWRPGTDELTIAGDRGTHPAADWLPTPVSVYSVSTGELRELGSIEAADVTWAPDGATLAYAGPARSDAHNRLWLVDADGDNARMLVSDIGRAIHGIGPVWSPAGDRIAYQRLVNVDVNSGEQHKVALVNVDDGTETVIEPPQIDGRTWYPFTVSWSPDGTTLLYVAWNVEGAALPNGILAVPADLPIDAKVLADAGAIAKWPVPEYSSHRWTLTQMWGRQPG